MEGNDLDGLDDLTKFIFDPPPLSDNEGGNENIRNAPNREGVAEEVDCPSSQSPPKRVARRRARKACIACHKRKVRCDLLSRGHTCTNCRLDSITCVVRQSGKRTRRKKSEINKDGAKSNKAARSTSTKKTSPKPFNVSQSSNKDIPDQGKGTITEPAIALSFPNNDQNTAAPGTLIPEDEITETQPVARGGPVPNILGDMLYSYYDFVEAESISHLSPDDFQFLEYKGCFHLPARPILDELVRQYFLHVHPVFPLIDEQLFWEAYSPVGMRPPELKIPLFVFRAMLFVSCSYAPDDTIQQLGFQRPLEARNCMYQRAQLLYQFNTTSELIALAQGTLILTHYCSGREPMANTSWLRLAIQYAHSAGVSDYYRDMNISEGERMTRKRLWWCIILRDRILPLGVRRPIEIDHGHFDFSQPRLEVSDLEHEFGYSQVYDRETKAALANILMAQIDLAVALTDVISLVYPVSGYRSFDRLDYNAMRSMSPKIKQCMNSLGSSYSAFQNMCSMHNQARVHESVSLYNGLTRIYFQSARAALCQFASFMIQADDQRERDEKIKQLGSAMHASITTIADVIKECVQVKMARFLPISMVAYLALPIVLNSLDVKSLPSSNTRTEAKRRQLRLLNTAMDIYRERYSGTSVAQEIITQTIEDTRAEQHASAPAKEPASSLACNQPVGDWLDIFIHKPAEYLRISFRVDISLSSGYYAKQEFLPQRLYLQLDLLSNTQIPKSLMPPMDEFQDDYGQKLFDFSDTDGNQLDFLNLSQF